MVFLGKSLYHFAYFKSVYNVQTGSRLVHYSELRLGHYRPCEQELSYHAAGVASYLVRKSVLQTAYSLAPLHVFVKLVLVLCKKGRHKFKIIYARHCLVGSRFVGEICDVLPYLVGFLNNAVPRHDSVSAGGLYKSGYHANGSGFACSVWTYKSEYLAFVNAEAYPVGS